MQGRTPLHNAAFANDTEAVKILLRYGADATAVDSQVRPLALFASVYEGVGAELVMYCCTMFQAHRTRLERVCPCS